MTNKDARIEDILNECLESVHSKRATVEDCLALHPQYAAELEPMLRMALEAGKASAIEPSAEFKARARYRFQEAIRAKAERRPARRHIWQRGWAIALATVVAVAILGSGTMAASASAMPDQPLYPVKMAKEQVQVFLARTPVEKAKLNTSLAETRLQEMAAMAAKGKVAQVNKLVGQFDAQLMKLEAPANLSATDAAALRQNLEEQSVKQIDTLQKLARTVPPQAQPAIYKALQQSEARYEKALQSAGVQPEQMEKIKGRWQHGPKKTPPGQSDVPTQMPASQANAPTPTPSQMSVPTSTPGQTNSPVQAPPDQANGLKKTQASQMSVPTLTPLGQANTPTPTPLGQTNAPAPTHSGQANGSMHTPPGQMNAPTQTPPGLVNTPTPAPSGQQTVPTPTPPGKLNGPKQTPPGKLKKV